MKGTDDDPYKECCLYTKHVCGSYTPGRDVIEGLVKVKKLYENSVDQYLKNTLYIRNGRRSFGME